MPVVNRQTWDTFLTGYSGVHLLQTSAWGEFKRAFGWDVVRVTAAEAGAQVLFRQLPLGFSLAYIPKGPVGTNWEQLWAELDTICRKKRAAFLKVEPDCEEQEQLTIPDGFQLGHSSIQPQRTILVDISVSEEKILQRMKQKTRYNIRLAKRRGVEIHSSEDIEGFYKIIKLTGERDGFGVHSQEYYQDVYETFHPQDQCVLLVAEFEGKPLAGLMVFQHQSRAWYFYGASNDEHRNLMPTYLLQWEAIRWAKTHNCTTYDLWGVPDADEQILEAEFSNRSDGLWGVYRFKRGFGGRVQKAAGPWDRVYHPLLYSLYRWWTRQGE